MADTHGKIADRHVSIDRQDELGACAVAGEAVVLDFVGSGARRRLAQWTAAEHSRESRREQQRHDSPADALNHPLATVIFVLGLEGALMVSFRHGFCRGAAACQQMLSRPI
jgi:hypothetical protein